MASKRDEIQEEVRFKILRLLSDNSEISTRQIAKAAGISNGGAYYCLNALVQKGLIKLGNFRASPHKGRYAYILTPQGIKQKSILTSHFLKRKMMEYKELKVEIAKLQKEQDLKKDQKILKQRNYENQ